MNLLLDPLFAIAALLLIQGAVMWRAGQAHRTFAIIQFGSGGFLLLVLGLNVVVPGTAAVYWLMLAGAVACVVGFGRLAILRYRAMRDRDTTTASRLGEALDL